MASFPKMEYPVSNTVDRASVTESVMSNKPMVLAQRFSPLGMVRRRVVTNAGNQIIGGVLLNQVGFHL